MSATAGAPHSPAGEVRHARDAIVARLLDRLRASESALVADAFVEEELVAQLDFILGRVWAALGVDDADARAAVASHELDVGRARARQNIHPVDSLTAATELFDFALDVLGDAPWLPSDADATARVLNATIMETVIPASVAYVDVLLERLSVAHTEERRSISRDLHDRVAHSIAAGIQRLALTDRGPRQLGEDEREARRLFETALDDTRAIALNLRHSVEEKRLDEAVQDYVVDLEATGPLVSVAVEGEPYRLPTGVQEEAFIVIREAIHNARRHSRATRILVTSHWEPETVGFTVQDDGDGFRHDGIRPGALGLIAAQERAELLGADLTIETAPEDGTLVTLVIPRRKGTMGR